MVTGRTESAFWFYIKGDEGRVQAMDAAQAVFDQTLQDEENGRKPVGVRSEASGDCSAYAVPDGLILRRAACPSA